jgi:hypothetical protein
MGEELINFSTRIVYVHAPNQPTFIKVEISLALCWTVGHSARPLLLSIPQATLAVAKMWPEFAHKCRATSVTTIGRVETLILPSSQGCYSNQ